MIICKICNSDLVGNGYCAEHSTGGSAYLMKKDYIEERLAEFGSLFSFPHNAINAKAEIPQRDGVPLIYNGMCVTEDIKSFISSLLSAQREQIMKEVREVLESVKITGHNTYEGDTTKEQAEIIEHIWQERIKPVIVQKIYPNPTNND